MCGLKDTKCQKELLCIVDLTAAVAMQKALAAEVVTLEAKAMQEPQQVTQEMHKLRMEIKCYRCGKQGHNAVECKHKKAKCHLYQKVGECARQVVAREQFRGMLELKHLNTLGQEVVLSNYK